MFSHVPFKWLKQKLRQVRWEEAEGISDKRQVGVGVQRKPGWKPHTPASNGLTRLPAHDRGDRVGTGVAGILSNRGLR